MPSKYWENFADLSRNSSAESSHDFEELSDVEEVVLPREKSSSDEYENGSGIEVQNAKETVHGDANSAGNGDQDSLWNPDEKEDKRPVHQNANVGTVSRAMAANFRLPALPPHEHASLFYLSLIEGRCRTQAAASINAGRPVEDYVAENHPDVDALASHIFAEMSKELLKAGMIPEEFVGRPLPELRLYLSSFDTMLNNIVATTPQDLPEFDSYRTLDSNYNLHRGSRGSIATITSSEDSLEIITGNRPSHPLRSGSAFETQPSHPHRTGPAFETRPRLPRTESAYETRPSQSLRSGSAFETEPSQPLQTGPDFGIRAQPLRTGPAFKNEPSPLDDPSQRALTTTKYNSSQIPSFTTPFNTSRALVRGSVPVSPYDQPSYESAVSAKYIDFDDSLPSYFGETEFNSRALVLRNQSANMSQSSTPATPGPIPRVISLLSTGKDLSEISDPHSIFESQYTIKKVLGAGGFGRVYNAEYYLDKAEVGRH